MLKYRSVSTMTESKNNHPQLDPGVLCDYNRKKNTPRKLFLENYWLRSNNYYFIKPPVFPPKFSEFPRFHFIFLLLTFIQKFPSVSIYT